MKRVCLGLAAALAALLATGLGGRDSLSFGLPEPQPAPSLALENHPYLPGEVLVKLRAGQTAQGLYSETLRAAGGGEVEDSGLPGLYRLRLLPGVDVEETAAAVARLPQVEYAEPNYLLRIAALPNDPLFNGLQKWYYDLLGAPRGWDVETGSRAIVVAVVDTGIDLDHPDLRNKLWSNLNEFSNGLDDDSNGFADDFFGWNFVANNGFPDDDNPSGHGTFVAGLIGAEANNNEGVAGVAWRPTLMAVKVASGDGAASTIAVARGLRYAAANGARIINLSLAGVCDRILTLADAVEEVQRERGVIIVAAAGNDGQPCVTYPAAEPGVIAVGASAGPVVTDPESLSGLSCKIDAPFDPDRRAIFTLRPPFSSSNWGPEIEVAAPGQCLASTSNGRLLDLYTNRLQGTSFASALVSGLTALLLSQDPSRNAAEVNVLLCASAVDLPDGDTPGWDGCGRISIGRALTLISTRLHVGWNPVVWQPAGCQIAPIAFNHLTQRGLLRVGWRFLPESQSWQGFDPLAPEGVNTLTQVCQGQILWVNVPSGTVWVQGP